MTQGVSRYFQRGSKEAMPHQDVAFTGVSRCPAQPHLCKLLFAADAASLPPRNARVLSQPPLRRPKIEVLRVAHLAARLQPVGRARIAAKLLGRLCLSACSARLALRHRSVGCTPGHARQFLGVTCLGICAPSHLEYLSLAVVIRHQGIISATTALSRSVIACAPFPLLAHCEHMRSAEIIP